MLYYSLSSPFYFFSLQQNILVFPTFIVLSAFICSSVPFSHAFFPLLKMLLSRSPRIWSLPKRMGSCQTSLGECWPSLVQVVSFSFLKRFPYSAPCHECLLLLQPYSPPRPSIFWSLQLLRFGRLENFWAHSWGLFSVQTVHTLWVILDSRLHGLFLHKSPHQETCPDPALCSSSHCPSLVPYPALLFFILLIGYPISYLAHLYYSFSVSCVFL